MVKKARKIHERFESIHDNGKFLKITYDMFQSEAWDELSLMEQGLYIKFKQKYTKYKDCSDNRNNISMPKSEYEKFMNMRTFWKCVDNLIEHGFIKVVQDRWTTRESTVYGFSDQWKFYKTTKFTITNGGRRHKRK
jgi:hypothetical protein